jgi:hypothetical protein
LEIFWAFLELKGQRDVGGITAVTLHIKMERGLKSSAEERQTNPLSLAC